MNEIFKPMFAKEPDQVVSGDYYYRIPWIEAEQKKYHTWTETEESLARQEAYSQKTFLSNWNKRSLTGEFDEAEDDPCMKEVKKNPEKSEIFRIFSEIAASGTPVVDLCSSEHMGLLPYLLKLNPHLPCLAQDVNVHELHRLRRRIDENFPDFNVSLASFDNLDMPFSDNIVPCITGSGCITHCSMNRNFEHKIGATMEKMKEAFRKFTEELLRQAIREVYRVLKPGGLLILEDDFGDVWEYDLQKINAFFEDHELLYGLYSREMVMNRLEKREEEQKKTVPYEEELLSAGFEPVWIERSKWKFPVSETVRNLSLTGDPVELFKPIIGEDLIQIFGKSELCILRKSIK